MDPLILNLKSTTFLGRHFTRRKISDILETIILFPAGVDPNARDERGYLPCNFLEDNDHITKADDICWVFREGK